jgi:hypothetical protein
MYIVFLSQGPFSYLKTSEFLCWLFKIWNLCEGTVFIFNQLMGHGLLECLKNIVYCSLLGNFVWLWKL